MVAFWSGCWCRWKRVDESVPKYYLALRKGLTKVSYLGIYLRKFWVLLAFITLALTLNHWPAAIGSQWLNNDKGNYGYWERYEPIFLTTNFKKFTLWKKQYSIVKKLLANSSSFQRLKKQYSKKNVSVRIVLRNVMRIFLILFLQYIFSSSWYQK